MKQVVSEFPNHLVAVTQVSSFKYYGLQITPNGPKGFIARERYNNGEHVVYSGEGCTQGNQFQSLANLSLFETVSKAVQLGFTVWEFDTHKELFAWLADC